MLLLISCSIPVYAETDDKIWTSLQYSFIKDKRILQWENQWRFIENPLNNFDRYMSTLSAGYQPNANLTWLMGINWTIAGRFPGNRHHRQEERYWQQITASHTVRDTIFSIRPRFEIRKREGFSALRYLGRFQLNMSRHSHKTVQVLGRSVPGEMRQILC